MSLKYLFERATKLNKSAIPEYVGRVRKNSGKIKMAIYLDMFGCALKYGAGYVDYTIFGMFNLNSKQRKNVLTRQKNGEYVRVLNPRSERYLLDDKLYFLENNKELCKRDFLNLKTASEADFTDFCRKYNKFVVKILDGKCGKGVEVVSTAEFGVHVLYKRLIENKQFVAEQLIEQHEQINALYANSVNTLRIVTVIDNNGEVHIVFTCIRLGRGKSNVDNFNSGGMTAIVEMNSGKITGKAINKNGELFCAHPDTNVEFDGYEIPMWKECLSLAKEAAKKNDKIRYVGWDVAVTPQGPVIVEGNEYPGHDLYQLYGQTENPIGMAKVLDEIVPYKYIKSKKNVQ